MTGRGKGYSEKYMGDVYNGYDEVEGMDSAFGTAQTPWRCAGCLTLNWACRSSCRTCGPQDDCFKEVEKYDCFKETEKYDCFKDVVYWAGRDIESYSIAEHEGDDVDDLALVDYSEEFFPDIGMQDPVGLQDPAGFLPLAEETQCTYAALAGATVHSRADNQIGDAYWELFCLERGVLPDGQLVVDVSVPSAGGDTKFDRFKEVEKVDCFKVVEKCDCFKEAVKYDCFKEVDEHDCFNEVEQREKYDCLKEVEKYDCFNAVYPAEAPFTEHGAEYACESIGVMVKCLRDSGIDKHSATIGDSIFECEARLELLAEYLANAGHDGRGTSPGVGHSATAGWGRSLSAARHSADDDDDDVGQAEFSSTVEDGITAEDLEIFQCGHRAVLKHACREGAGEGHQVDEHSATSAPCNIDVNRGMCRAA